MSMQASKHSRSGSSATRLFSVVLVLLIVAAPTWAAEDDANTEDELEVDVGLQGVSLDADEPGEARFLKYQDNPEGAVLNHLRWNHTSANNYFHLEAWDATQKDERFDLNAGYGDAWKVRAGFQRTPFIVGGGAVLPLARGDNDEYGATFGIADFIQQGLEDPDGNGVPFYTDAAETANDNALVFDLANELLADQESFFVGTERETGFAGFSFAPGSNWTVDFDATQDSRDGTLPLGSGTYQRITDVNGDGTTDYDYFFSVRGVELPAPIEYKTTRFSGSLNYQRKGWFVNARAQFSDFDAGYRGLTYDNTFWMTDTQGGGAMRGLWNFGRTSLPPSNEAWDLALSGGFNLPGRTRITGLVSLGEMKQDDLLMPMTTNTATIGTADINGDGFVDANDDPTTTDVFNAPFVLNGVPTVGRSLGASIDTQMLNLTVTSKPIDRLKLLGRFRSYSYEGQEGIQAVSGRTEYIESRLVTSFKGDTILHVPLDYTRNTAEVEATYGFTRQFRLRAFYKMLSYDYDQYRFDPAETDSTRDAGSRAVDGTDDNVVGLTGMFGGAGWFSGHLTVSTSDRTYDGDYRPAFSGENADVRQYDIANRERDAVLLRFDFTPADAWTFGIGYRYAEDDYVDTEFGLLDAELQSVDLSLGYTANERLNLFLYGDISSWDGDMRLATKCSNCGAPDPGLAPWDIPGYDWLSEYTDNTTAVGFALAYASTGKQRFDLSIDYTEGKIEQDTVNPVTPTELNPANPLFGQVANVALGFRFPDQESTTLEGRVKWSYRVNRLFDAGISYIYQDFDLVDFQLDGLDAYGANFLEVDDATRFLLLGSRIGDYTAHIGQVFVRFTL